MRVKNQNGDWRDLDFLHSVRINGRRAYEVDHFDVESNVATASWQAGATNSEMRREKGRISEIKTNMEKEADKAHELMANFTSIVRGQVGDVAEEIVMVAEEVDLPSERAGLHERLGESLERSDPSEDLVTGFEEQTSDPEDVDIDEQDAAEASVSGLDADADASAVSEGLSDIFDRAAQMQKSKTNGHSGDSGGSGDE